MKKENESQFIKFGACKDIPSISDIEVEYVKKKLYSIKIGKSVTFTAKLDDDAIENFLIKAVYIFYLIDESVQVDENDLSQFGTNVFMIPYPTRKLSSGDAIAYEICDFDLKKEIYQIYKKHPEKFYRGTNNG